MRRSSKGTALFGGSPFRLVRLSSSGARLLDGWLSGEVADDSSAATKLRSHLLAAGMVHPVIDKLGSVKDPAFVIPVYDDSRGLERLLSAIRREFPDAPIVVVDDASHDAAAIERAAARAKASLIRHKANRGPGAARNTGWRAVPAVPVVVFVDADARPQRGAITRLLAHFDLDPVVAAVAGRVRAEAGSSFIDRYEATESPLDLGSEPALVQPGSRVSYVPTAFVAVKLTELEALGGFDETMRVGEDVDFVWRLVELSRRVRYEPGAVVEHRNRSGLRALLRQRRTYGSSAAGLDRRHPGKVAPIQLSPRVLAAWALVAFGPRRTRWLGLAAAAIDAAALHHKLVDKVEAPVRETARLSAMGHGHAAHWLARATTRVWLPLFALAALVSRRARRLLAVAAIAPPLVSWLRGRRPFDPARYTALRIVDDAAYCVGVWSGVISERSLGALLPGLGRTADSGDEPEGGDFGGHAI